jgi:hypothetical protein
MADAGNPVVSTLTFSGSVAGQATIQAQGIGGNLTFLLPNIAPIQGQLLDAAVINGNNVFLGWASPASGTVASVSGAGIATGIVTSSGSITVLGTSTNGSLVAVTDSSGSIKTAEGGNIVTTDGDGNVQSSGMPLSSLIHTVELDLSAAQLNSLSVVSVAFPIPVPGVGRFIVPLALSVLSYKFNTTPYANALLYVGYAGSFPYDAGFGANLLSFSSPLTSTADILGFSALPPVTSGPSGVQGLPETEADNQQIVVYANSTTTYTKAPIVSTILGQFFGGIYGPRGGTAYAVGDTGTIRQNNSSMDATYRVLTVDDSGAVLTYEITNPGTYYGTTTLVDSLEDDPTTADGPQPGVGTGFTVDVVSVSGPAGSPPVSQGDGTAKITLAYFIANV